MLKKVSVQCSHMVYLGIDDKSKMDFLIQIPKDYMQWPACHLHLDGYEQSQPLNVSREDILFPHCPLAIYHPIPISCLSNGDHHPPSCSTIQTNKSFFTLFFLS